MWHHHVTSSCDIIMLPSCCSWSRNLKLSVYIWQIIAAFMNGVSFGSALWERSPFSLHDIVASSAVLPALASYLFNDSGGRVWLGRMGVWLACDSGMYVYHVAYVLWPSLDNSHPCLCVVTYFVPSTTVTDCLSSHFHF